MPKCGEYKTLPYDSCACGQKITERKVTCVIDGVKQDSLDACAGQNNDGTWNKKPPTTKLCPDNPCPEAKWILIDSTPCSASCGGGTSTNTYKCFDMSTNEESDLCDAINMPPTVKPCGNPNITTRFDDHV